MLVDVNFARPNPYTAAILSVIGSGSFMPRRVGVGLYEALHWGSPDKFGILVRERWREPGGWTPPPWEEFGVCDNPQQVVDAYELADRPEELIVMFVKIIKAEQGEGGWRWHKWGPYIGTKSPQCEYIADEGPEIEEVYTFHIYELLDD